MKCLVWNCRGARKQGTQDRMLRIVHSQRVGVVFLLETRVGDNIAARIHLALGCGWERLCVPAVGFSGGIMVFWRTDLGGFNFQRVSNQLVLGRITPPNQPPWLICGVYAKVSYLERRPLWEDLAAILTQGLPTLVVGDFNVVTCAEERLGGASFSVTSGVQDFLEFINSNQLSDVGFSGPLFTYCNNQDGSERTFSRLDRGLASATWLHRFPEATIKHLARTDLDHCPLLVDPEASRRVSF